jgi:hypothetical protein
MRRVLLLIPFVLLTLSFSSEKTGKAERAEKIFIELLTNPEKGQTHSLLEEDLNAYISRELESQPLRGVEKLFVELKEGTFTTDVTVNLDNIGLSGYLEYLKNLVEGPQDLTLEGSLEVTEGVGVYKTHGAWLNGIPLPPSVVDTLLSALGRQQDPPFDPTEEFEAPFGITDLEIKPGVAVLRK